MAWRSDSYLAMGMLGFALFVLLGITSLPSVSNSLNWREFSCIQVLNQNLYESFYTITDSESRMLDIRRFGRQHLILC